jgi:anti-repressor protein
MKELMKLEATMSSREIAELVGSKHGDVKRSAERLSVARILTSPLAQFDFEHNGNVYHEYRFNKRDSLVLVARLSPEFTAAVVDRWQELESKNVAKLPGNYIEALEALIESEKQKAIMEPKADVYDRIVDRNNLYNATQVAQKFGQSAVWMNKQLSDLNVYNRTVKRGRAFQQWFIDKGYGIMRETESGHSQPMFYAEGEMWIIEKLTSEGLI